jgi:hypothetical protein
MVTWTTHKPRTGVAHAYTVLAWLFVACLAVQMLLAGLAVFDGASYWQPHRAFVHLFEYLPIVLLILAITARLRPWMIWLTLVEILQIALQYALVNLGNIAAAFHPLNGTVLFVVAIALAHAAGRYARRKGIT